MSKTWNTKRRILKLLSKRQMTMSELSTELGLVPSTVSQHIEYLRNVGAITEIDNPYVKKWRYYRANPDFNIDSFLIGGHGLSKLSITIGAIAGIVVALALILIFSSSHQANHNTLLLSITDPPYVPNGTQSLTIDYSSIQFYVKNNSSASGWINASGSGSLDLLSLLNESEVIGSANIKTNTSISEVRLKIESAMIRIQGREYDVEIPNGTITTYLNDSIRSKSEVLIDLSSTVSETYSTENSSSETFVMMPNVKGVVFSTNSSLVSIGSKSQLTAQQIAGINSSSLNVSGVDISSTSNGNSLISMTIENNGAVPVKINGIEISGNFNVSLFPYLNSSTSTSTQISAPNGMIQERTFTLPDVNSTTKGEIGNNLSVLPGRSTSTIFPNISGVNSITSTNSIIQVGNSSNKNIGISSNTQISSSINNSESTNISINNNQNSSNEQNALSKIGIEISNQNVHLMINSKFNASNLSNQQISNLRSLVNLGTFVANTQSLNFIVESNGHLSVPYSESDFNSSIGYIVQPGGGSITLTFNGPVSVNNDLLIRPISGNSYKLIVESEGSSSVAVTTSAS